MSQEEIEEYIKRKVENVDSNKPSFIDLNLSNRFAISYMRAVQKRDYYCAGFLPRINTKTNILEVAAVMVKRSDAAADKSIAQITPMVQPIHDFVWQEYQKIAIPNGILF